MWARVSAVILFCVGLSIAHAQMPPNVSAVVFDGLPKKIAGGRSCIDGTHAAAFNARTSGQNNAHLDANCVFINGLDTDSLFALGDAAYLLATDTAANAALNIISSSHNITLTGSPTFTTDSGYVGGGTTNLNTNLNVFAGGFNYTQNANSVFIWSLTNFTGGVSTGGAFNYVATSANNVILLPHFSDNLFYWDSQSTTFQSAATAVGHFYGFARSASAVATAYKDTTSFSDTTTSSVLINDNFSFLNDTNNTRPLTVNLAFGWIGGTLNGTQQGKLFARVHTYMQSIAGAP